MTDRPAYLRPSWFYRRVVAAIPGADQVAARLMSLVTGDAMLQVRGRRSGRLRTTLARTVTVGGSRYIVAIRGETQWSRNLRVASEALLRDKGRTTRIRATEVQGEERQLVVKTFLDSSRYGPTRKIMAELLPNAEQHPVFRID